MVILKRALQYFTHLPDLQFSLHLKNAEPPHGYSILSTPLPFFVSFRLTLILMDQTYGNGDPVELGVERVDNLNKLLSSSNLLSALRIRSVGPPDCLSSWR